MAGSFHFCVPHLHLALSPIKSKPATLRYKEDDLTIGPPGTCVMFGQAELISGEIRNGLGGTGTDETRNCDFFQMVRIVGDDYHI